ncbi:MAG: PAS domain-containing protein, partial [Desulfobacterales bacterium]|nr:PAS domain-containing protein [Desulfobacterales bacterium]
ENYRYIDFTLFHKQTMKEIWGADIEIGGNILDYICVESDRKNAKKSFDKALSGEHFVLYEEYGAEELKRTFFEDRYSPIFDEENNIIGLAVYAIDITDRIRAEAALRESEERFALAMQGANDGLWDWNLEAGVVYFSPRWKGMLGHAEHEVEPTLEAWKDLVHPDDLPLALERLGRYLAGDVDKYELEFRMRHKDGHYVDILSRASALRRGSDGAPVRMVGTHVDITERKRAEEALQESEERFALAMRGANDGLWDWNLETGVVYFSPRWKSMLGYAEHEVEPTLEAWKRLVHPDDLPFALERVKRFLAGEIDKYEIEFRMRRKDGHYADILARATTFRRGSDNAPRRMVGTHVDITERKRAAKALKQAKDASEKARRAAEEAREVAEIADRAK